MEVTFTGKTALVSGASKGIGRGIALQLAKCGAKVIALGRNEDDLACLKEEIPSIHTIVVDLSDWSETKQSLNGIEKIDLLVNNAGIAVLSPLGEIEEHDIDQLFSVNFKAVVNLTQIVTQNLINRNVGGSIVNISSKASMRGIREHAVYCATKASVDSFTKVAALELGEHNIRINCVNPTVVMTELGLRIWSDPHVVNEMKAKIPLKRFAEVKEVVDAVMFLLSDKASMITGTCMRVDGGCLAAL
ncbi:hypothetical protein RI129_009883 [Pyrocoelia pectoralis]|uniref:L-xylulose reductase n=1 Tax=Pyrocoelia pectoralis TaxID=417401 RepID=A0AAN7V9C0_9COLE